MILTRMCNQFTVLELHGTGTTGKKQGFLYRPHDSKGTSSCNGRRLILIARIDPVLDPDIIYFMSIFIAPEFSWEVKLSQCMTVVDVCPASSTCSDIRQLREWRKRALFCLFRQSKEGKRRREDDQPK